MRVLSRNGHFAFYPTHSWELNRFCETFNLELDRDRDFYTFPALAGAERYAIKGKPYLGLTPTVTCEGEGPWDVLRLNGFVYSLVTNTLVPKSSIAVSINPIFNGKGYVAQTPLVQPGSKNVAGLVVKSYDAVYDFAYNQLLVMGFEYE